MKHTPAAHADKGTARAGVFDRVNDLFRRLRKLHNLSPERRSFLVWERVSAIIWGALRPWESSTSGGGNVDGSKGVLVGDVERSGRVAGGVWFESREPCPDDGVEGRDA